MIQVHEKDACCGCHACATACPVHCITMVADHEGFLYPQVDQETCVDCHSCERVCPMALPMPDPGDPPLTFAAWNRDESTRLESSSGGVFDALMHTTLHHGGVVFGAAFDAHLTLRHSAAETREDCLQFRGSKYLQSSIGDTYQQAAAFLAQERKVLFSGTPCQIAGLYSFLGQKPEHLLTCDVVCHGVPSPQVFAAYRAQLEKRYGAPTSQITFRQKDAGWKRYAMSFLFDNKKKYQRAAAKDPFITGFLTNTYLRPSCHACRFSRLPRVADLSLGDFWGVEKHHPEWNDDKGTSLILAQTAKGEQALQACSAALIVQPADFLTALASNPCITGSVSPGKHRIAFFQEFNRQPFQRLIKKYLTRPTLWHRGLSRIKRLVWS